MSARRRIILKLDGKLWAIEAKSSANADIGDTDALMAARAKAGESPVASYPIHAKSRRI